MCGRYLLATRPDIVVEQFAARMPGQIILPRFNMAPGQQHPLLTRQKQREFSLFTWGLQFPQRPLVINIRAESIFAKDYWQRELRQRRCLIPATGYYEWERKTRQPYHIFAAHASLLAFAGITYYNRATNAHQFAIITREAPSQLSHIHHRAPLTIAAKQWHKWLAADTDHQELLSVGQSINDSNWRFLATSTRVNSVTNDDKSLLHAAPIQEKLF
jgi:putative SOS response-associated peptidase YedK